MNHQVRREFHFFESIEVVFGWLISRVQELPMPEVREPSRRNLGHALAVLDEWLEEHPMPELST